MNETSINGSGPFRGSVFILDTSKRCEPSAFLFTKAVHFFLVNGYTVEKSIRQSDIVLVNSCCVTEDKMKTSMAALEYARSHGVGKLVVLFGCMAGLPLAGLEVDRSLIRIGPKNVDELDSLFPHDVPVNDISTSLLSPALYEPGQGLGYGDHFLMIAQGCSNRCSYCNIKRVKGDVSSVAVPKVLTDLREGLARGAKDFVLLADDCASYGRDIGTDILQLMEGLFAESDAFGLKLGYLYPRFLLTHLEGLKRVFGTGRIKYANVPMQSGSSRILGLMNRHYEPARVREAMGELRAAAPGTTFCTHIMINFPTESDDDFEASLRVADDFDEVLFLGYSDNRDTPAAALFPKVPEGQAERRLDAASDYANLIKRGRSAVIADFDCDRPYNLGRKAEEP